jgi:neutral ceramidase
MSQRILALLLATSLSACASAPTAREAAATGLIPVGVAEIDITPAEPIRLTGYGNREQPTADVRQRLWAKAMAFGGDPDVAVLIAVDLVGVPSALTEGIARRLSNAHVRREQFVISATHTHTGPVVGGALPYIFNVPASPAQQQAIDRYTGSLGGKLEEVARAALANRRPSRLSWAIGRAGFAANRRVIKDGKWTGFGITPDGAVDHDLPVLAVHAPDGALRAVLVNYACHATTLEGRDNFLHGDWPGVAKDLIQRRHPGTMALVTIGTGADANPNPRGGGLPDVERNAVSVADEVDRLLAAPLRPLTSPPRGRIRTIDLDLATLPTRQELEERARKNVPDGFLAQALLARLNRGERLPATASYPIQAWAFGAELGMVFLGGEVVADYGLRLKRELDGSRLWVNAYSNDVAFYVASKRLIPEGGYEVNQSMVYYGQPARLADGTEDRIISTVRELLPPAFASRR